MGRAPDIIGEKGREAGRGNGLKIVVIGGGSSYTPELIGGILAHREVLPVSEICLVDLEAAASRLSAVAGLGRRMIRKAGAEGEIALNPIPDRSAALEGADFVISQFRTGGGAARLQDELLPLPHGVVGQETTGPGGFAAALRQIPVALELAAEMERRCPDAFLLNFTNPSGIITGALQRQGAVRCAGLCNIPLTLRRLLSASLGAAPGALELTFAGLNHLGWITRIALEGTELTSRIISAPETALFLAHDFPEIDPHQLRTLLRSLGVLPSPYLLYYYFPGPTLARARREAAEGRNRARQVLALEEALLELYRDPALAERPALLSQRGGACYAEAAISLMRALHGGSGREVLNVRNGGAVPELPEAAVVETDCLIRGRGIHPLPPGPLPPELRGLVQQVAAYEQLTIEAAMAGDKRAAYLALLAHPLVPGANTAEALLGEILKVNAPYLSQFGS